MPDDWRERYRSWLHPDSYAHPNSPAGGSGTGFSRTPGFTGYSWSPLPDPNSPAGRLIHLQTEIWALEQQERDEIARHVEELETSLANQSDKLRESIPDAYLRTLYDRQVGRTKGTYGFAKSLIGTGVDAALLLQKLTSPVGCFDPDLQRKIGQAYSFGLAISKSYAVWEFGTLHEKKQLLQHVATLAGRVFEEARNSIQRQWAEAKRTGKQEELIEKWKTRILLEVGALFVGAGELKAAGSAAEGMGATSDASRTVRASEDVIEASKAAKQTTLGKIAEDVELPKRPEEAIPRGCFVRGTEIMTPDGLAPIESLTPQRSVLCLDPRGGDIAVRRILRVFTLSAPVVFDIKTADVVITCTPGHPFWVPDCGWLEAKDLNIGTKLTTKFRDHVAVDSISRRTGSYTVFNIEVGELQTFLVSAIGVLVHNKSMPRKPLAERIQIAIDRTENLPPKDPRRKELLDKLWGLKAEEEVAAPTIREYELEGRYSDLDTKLLDLEEETAHPPINADSQMLGARGTKVTSVTIDKDVGDGIRVDVENPNPGQRPGQIQLQRGSGKGKDTLLYDPTTGEIYRPDNVRPSDANKITNGELEEIVQSPKFEAAIGKAKRILGVE